jgi:uncharacterized protein
MRFLLLSGSYSVYRFPPDRVPAIDFSGEDFVCLARTAEEVSLVRKSGAITDAEREEGGWRVLKIAGPIDFGVVGVLAGASGLLAAAGISIFAISTFDTDYILVKETSLEEAVEALRAGGHEVAGDPDLAESGAGDGGERP